MADDSKYLDGARRLLRLVADRLPEFEEREVASLLCVAVGLRVGEEVFPRDPRLALATAGLTIGATALFAQRQLIQETVQSCEGRA